MRRLVITFILILSTLLMVKAQDVAQGQTGNQRNQSVYLEFYGPSNMVGISYDARFKGNKHLGYRVGMGYDYGMAEISGFFNSKSHAFTIPAEINYLVGKGNSRLELGLGISLGYYYSHWSIQEQEDSDSAFGYFLFGNIGYRLTTRKGFQFRIGITPVFNFGGKHAVDHDSKLYPYLSFGYAF